MSDQTANSQNASILNGRYRLLAIVAGGGMATVYKAQDTLLNRVVAIKTLREKFAQDPQFVQRFREEAQAAANLNHPNIVTIFDVGSDQGNGKERNYIVMEFVEGQDLKTAIRERVIANELFSIEEAVGIARQVSEGVGYAHRRGLVHCDLKPQNVILNPDGRAKVADFGIARAYTAMVAERVDVVWGTPQYFSPEQAVGNAPTPASDVYSIGIMLYEMLSGRLPFESRDARELARMHMTVEPPALHTLNPSVPLQLEAIVRRMLAKDASNRYRDADQVARVLASYIQQGDEQTLHSPLTPPVDAGSVRLPAQRSGGTSVNRTSQTPSRVTTPPQIVTGRPSTSVPSANAPRLSSRNGVSVTGSIGPLTTSATSQQPGTDILLWLLSGLALLCVLGLIPVWALVSRAYNPPGQSQNAVGPNQRTPTVFVTVTAPIAASKPITVPNLVGMSAVKAAQNLSTLGLQSRIVAERPDAKATEAIVVEQQPAAGALVFASSSVELVVSKLVQSQPVPGELIGQMMTDELSRTLKTVGWTVALAEQYSLQPEGTIIALNPPAGTQLSLSDTLRLTLSSGGRVDLNVDMQPIVLDYVRFGQDQYNPGQSFQFSVQWRATGAVGRDYRVFVHVLKQNGTPVDGVRANGDRIPMNNGIAAPTAGWTNGTIVNDTFEVTLPANMPAGNYRIEIGMYDDQGRLHVNNYGFTPAQPNGVNSILLRTIRVG